MSKLFPIAVMLYVAGMSAAFAAAPVCLSIRAIQSTETPNASTIVFHMKNGEVWRNTLKAPCPDLTFEGFIWSLPGVEEVCGGQQSLHVLQSGETCVLGKFEKTAPKRPG